MSKINAGDMVILNDLCDFETANAFDLIHGERYQVARVRSDGALLLYGQFGAVLSMWFKKIS